MPEYDFHQLSPPDLEVLVRDLLQAHWRVTIESFKDGRDGGIDLRYARGPSQTIIQVKHYVRTGFRGLLRSLKKEARNLYLLNPNRYIFVTSVPLSPLNKDEIVRVFNSRALNQSDVLGAGELNNLLAQYPVVEQNHYKLWLASRAILDRVLHNAAATRSEFKARQVYRQARRYVANSAFPRAMQILDKERVVVISGPPGVGKTTLADLLLYNHLARGFRAVLVERDPSEGLEQFDPNIQQVFYYDDFMGATFAGDRRGIALGNEDRSLVNFINLVRDTPNARLVLTTREHVYSQAMGRSERLREAGLDAVRVMLHMPSYDFHQRARILYNHIYFSDLPSEFQDQIVSDAFYLKIVKHNKFNPRLIEWLSSYDRINVSVSDYRNFIQSLLDDPSDIWKHAYYHEISDAARSLLLALWSMSGRVNTGRLRQIFFALHEARSARYRFEIRAEDYAVGLRELANSFVRPTEIGNGVEVIDPSVLDLMNSVVREAPATAVDLLSSSVSFAQVARVWQFALHQESGEVLTELRQHNSRFAAHVASVAAMPRQSIAEDGTKTYSAPPYELRLIVLLQMANKLNCATMTSQLAPTFDTLVGEWHDTAADLPRILDLLHALAEDQPNVAAPLLQEMRRGTEVAASSAVRFGVPAEQLQDLIASLRFFEDTEAIKEAVRVGFDEYATATLFQEDLAELRSSSQCSDLIKSLEAIGNAFAVNTAVLISKVELERGDLEEIEEQRADYDYDAWKDGRGEQRASEQYLSEMFSSLRRDR